MSIEPTRELDDLAAQAERLAGLITTRADVYTGTNPDAVSRLVDATSRMRRALRRIRATTTARCSVCGDTFVPLRADARYCSGACRQRAHRARTR